MRRVELRRLWCVVLCTLVAAGLASPSVADQKEVAKAEVEAVEELRDDLAESSAEMVRAAEELRAARVALKAARAAVVDARVRLA